MTALEIELHEHVPVARPHEDVDAANARSVEAKLIEAVGAGDALVLDLGATRYVDSAGVDMIFRLGERLRQRRARFALVIPSASPLARLAEIVGMPRAVAVFETVEQALEAGSTEKQE